ncbi:dynamin family protein [Zoogloea sp.]|uniref:dynamin family protein n=1 Tax=Zoogloea sp. TaxID=49181 RepID=UPI0035B14FBB
MLVEHFSAYTQWRAEIAAGIGELRTWLQRNEVGDAQSDLRLQYLLDRLREDKLVVAFVAEFSRGKSELINAVFFAGYGNRILPSSAGRTTMCPTELQWQAGDVPQIRLLPIESRRTDASISDLKRQSAEWQIRPLDTSSAENLQQALAQVGETRMASADEARALSFPIDETGEKGLRPNAEGQVEIPRWRHAVIQFQHPLLEQGLVILDTPGLNAIGAEPELTLNLLPNAHAVLFILAADTGVTQSDLGVWRDHVNAGRRQRGRLVALNKIDGLWDGLRSEEAIEREIQHQVSSVAQTLEIDPGMVFPVSAQKGLVAKVNSDPDLLARSRILELEHALSTELVPTKQDIVRDNTSGEVHDIVGRSLDLLNARLSGLREQLHELTDLRGKNQNVIEYMMRKVRSEKDEFEQGLQKYYAVRSVFSNMSNNLFAHLGLDALRDETRRTREAMLDAAFSRGLRDAMRGFFNHLRGNLQKSTDEITEIAKMLDAMYKRFTIEHGLKLASPSTFSTARYEKEIDRLEEAFNKQLNSALIIMTTEKHVLTQKFFETVAVQARRTFEIANRDVEQWLRAVMAPLETQVREYQLQLKRRLESVKRIHQATDTLEDRVCELQQAEEVLVRQVEQLEAIGQRIYTTLDVQPSQDAAPASDAIAA